MVDFEFLKQNNKIIGFRTNGHAMYAEHGEDPVCAGISILTINTMNYIDEFTDDDMEYSFDEEVGYIDFKMTDSLGMTKDSEVLLKALHFGIKQIQDQYGDRYLKITLKEV